MVRAFILALAVVAAFATPPAYADDDTDAGFAEVTEYLVVDFIRPGFGRLSADTSALADTVEALCAEPGADKLAAVRTAYQSALVSFARIEFARIGPLVEGNRLERLLYWPDIRGATVKQASAAIATGDESVLSPDSIAQKSIALQGFGTLEYLLYGTPADTIATPDGSFACRFALAVSRNIATVAGEASAGWAEGAEFPRLLANPAPDNPLARTHKEAAERLLSLLPDSLETARDQRILPALGDSAKDSKVRRAPFWRSGLTLKVIAANLSGVVEAVKVSDIDDALPEDARFLVSNATFGLENVISVLDGLDGGFEAALKDPEGRDKLTYVTVAIREAREEIGPKLFQALDLTAGFNASDGD